MALAWCAFYIAELTIPHPCSCVKLPSWHGTDIFFGGSLPPKRMAHGFTSCDDGRIYVFGGRGKKGDLKRIESAKWLEIAVTEY